MPRHSCTLYQMCSSTELYCCCCCPSQATRALSEDELRKATYAAQVARLRTEIDGVKAEIEAEQARWDTRVSVVALCNFALDNMPQCQHARSCQGMHARHCCLPRWLIVLAACVHAGLFRRGATLLSWL